MLVVACQLAALAIGTLPQPVPGVIRGYEPDSPEYVFSAKALLSGQYVVVDSDGTTRVPRYPPGFPIMLAPAIAVGGIDAAQWVNYGAALLAAALTALVAWRAGGPLAAPLAMLAVVWTPGFVIFAQVIMSDIPALALAMLSLATLVMWWPRPAAQVACGFMAAALTVVRSPLLVVFVAGAIAIANWRLLRWYVAGAIPVFLALAVWQWATFGSPLATGYTAPGVVFGEGVLFAPRFVLGPPYNSQDRDSNTIAYARVLFGLSGWLIWPGSGILGLLGLARLARSGGVQAVVGRFGLAASVLTVAVHLPFFWQSERFLFIPAALLSIGCSTIVARLLDALACAAARAWRQRRYRRASERA